MVSICLKYQVKKLFGIGSRAAKQAGKESIVARKPKTKGVKYWKKKAWDEFSKYIRLRDALETTGTKERLVCCTCGKTYPAFGVGCAQAGHFITGRGNSILFDERGVHGQCYHCNIHLRGNWPEYMRFMMLRYGRKVVDELIHNYKLTVHYNAAEMQGIYEKYKQKLSELRAK
jgi:hypothetical protein